MDKPRYLSALIFFATSRPSWYWISGASPSFSSCSSRRSHFSAHSTIFTPGQYSLISASHFVDTFSSEPLLSTWSCQHPCDSIGCWTCLRWNTAWSPAYRRRKAILVCQILLVQQCPIMIAPFVCHRRRCHVRSFRILWARKRWGRNLCIRFSIQLKSAAERTDLVKTLSKLVLPVRDYYQHMSIVIFMKCDTHHKHHRPAAPAFAGLFSLLRHSTAWLPVEVR